MLTRNRNRRIGNKIKIYRLFIKFTINKNHIFDSHTIFDSFIYNKKGITFFQKFDN